MVPELADPTPVPRIDDLRLVVTDMDGTLLDDDGAVPEPLWELLETMAARGIRFTPASGRQLATLQRLFERAGDGLVFIAENGSYVVQDGDEVSSTTLRVDDWRAIVHAAREVSDTKDVGIVLCGKRSAYLENPTDLMRDEASRYYARLTDVDDLLAVDDDVLKVALYSHPGEAPAVAESLPGFPERLRTVVSGSHWVDVMRSDVDKGVAVRALQESLGVTADQTAAFGDYFNDAEMLDAVTHSFAMANAHPDVQARAAHIAPAASDMGVVTVLRELLGE